MLVGTLQKRNFRRDDDQTYVHLNRSVLDERLPESSQKSCLDLWNGDVFF